MPRIAVIVKVLIASPSDTREEREKIPDFISQWNTTHSEKYSVYLEAVLWETHATTQLGSPPQKLINKELVDNSDILIGTFWTRIGTETEQAESGTVEEIQKFIDSGKPVSLYLSRKEIDPAKIDHDQYERLNEFLKRIRHDKGIVRNYISIDELKTHFMRDITRHINLEKYSSLISPRDSPPQILDQIKQFSIKFRTYTERLKLVSNTMDKTSKYSSNLNNFANSNRDKILELYSESLTIGNKDISKKILVCAERLSKLLDNATPRLAFGGTPALMFVDNKYFWNDFPNILDCLEKICIELGT